MRSVCFRYHTHVLLSATAVIFTSAASAHPGHGESTPTVPAPEFFLAQAAASSPAKPVDRAVEKIGNAVHIAVEGEFRIIRSNGWPDHTPGTFPRRGNPNIITAQSYDFRIPINPTAAEVPVQRGGWWWGVALNGVPFEPGTAETWNNDPRSGWRYEAGTGFLNLGLDEHNAHVQPNGSYHYHALPAGLVERLGGDGKRMLHIGWAADGFPIYTSWAFADANDPKSALSQMKSSYRLKDGARPAQEGGPGGNYDGRFTQDFEYVRNAGDLDECNGRSGVTSEFPQGTYYYCITKEFPFVPRLWRGAPDASFGKGGPPPDTGPRGAGGFGPGREGRPKSPAMEVLDANHDGELDAEELKNAAAALRFLDRNKDGKLSPDEYLGGPRERSGFGRPESDRRP